MEAGERGWNFETDIIGVPFEGSQTDSAEFFLEPCEGVAARGSKSSRKVPQIAKQAFVETSDQCDPVLPIHFCFR